jgi:hypothetical protein
LLGVTDKILTGLFAHELAHYVERFVGFTESLLDAWDRLPVGAISEIPVGGGTLTEARVDLIAASLGFKEEILAKNLYTMECVAGYVEPPVPDGLSVTPSEALDQLKYRNEQVRLLVP